MKGIYVLVIELSRNVSISVGKLGPLHFDKGLYAYVGSAQVALEKRIERHFRKKKALFWHIDYLLQETDSRILRVFTRCAPKSDECRVASKIAEHGEAVKGFGCSDCGCSSHLFHLNDYDFLFKFLNCFVLPNPSGSS